MSTPERPDGGVRDLSARSARISARADPRTGESKESPPPRISGSPSRTGETPPPRGSGNSPPGNMPSARTKFWCPTGVDWRDWPLRADARK